MRERRDKEGRKTTKGWVIYQVTSVYDWSLTCKAPNEETMQNLLQDCPIRGREPGLLS